MRNWKIRTVAWLMDRWVLSELSPDRPPLSLTIDANEPWRSTGEREMDKKMKISFEYRGIQIIHVIMYSEQFDQLISKGMVGRLQQDISFEQVN